MKKYLAPFLLACGLAAFAEAQAAFNSAVCYKGCSEGRNSVMLDRHEARMKKIRAKKAEETDPEKIKELEAQETDEIERYDEERVKSCRKICQLDKAGQAPARD